MGVKFDGIKVCKILFMQGKCPFFPEFSRFSLRSVATM